MKENGMEISAGLWNGASGNDVIESEDGKR